jgi:hypothetical protein
MAKTPKLKVTKPVGVLKPIEVDFGSFKALGKGIGHTQGKRAELAADTVEGLTALGLKTEPENLLIYL